MILVFVLQAQPTTGSGGPIRSNSSTSNSERGHSMELFASLSFFGGALFGGLGLLAYRAFGMPLRIGYRHVIAAICLAVWMAVFWHRPWQPLALLAISGAALWAVRRKYIPTWLAVIITMTPLLLVKTGVSHLAAMLGLSFATFRAIDVLLFAPRNERISLLDYCIYVFSR